MQSLNLQSTFTFTSQSESLQKATWSCTLSLLKQLSFVNGVFAHNPVIVSVGREPSLDNILVAAHSEDTDYRPLSTYPVQLIRFLHIVGVKR